MNIYLVDVYFLLIATYLYGSVNVMNFIRLLFLLLRLLDAVNNHSLLSFLFLLKYFFSPNLNILACSERIQISHSSSKNL